MIEEVIYKYLSESNELGGMLARYRNSPAIFRDEAAKDTDTSWGDGPQYPRIVYTLNMQDDPQRKVSGTLTVDIMCYGNIQPETIEAVLRPMIDGHFFTDGDTTIAAMWDSSPAFTEQAGKYIISGMSVNFDVVAFPMQETSNPDPIQALNRWMKEQLPEATVIGLDELPAVWTPPDPRKPAIYFKLDSLGPGTIGDTYSVTWHLATIKALVISTNRTVRNTVAKFIVDNLAAYDRVKLLDGSNLFLKRLVCNMTADPIKEGQVTITGEYGVLTKRRVYPLIKQVIRADEIATMSATEETDTMETLDNLGTVIPAPVAATGNNVTQSFINGNIRIDGNETEVYRLPIATTEVLGGVIVGEGIEVDESGVITNEIEKVSQLDNDKGYQTAAQVESLIDDAQMEVAVAPIENTELKNILK